MFHKIRNPDTGNWVNITGTTGKTVLRKYLAVTSATMTGGSSVSPPRPPRQSMRAHLVRRREAESTVDIDYTEFKNLIRELRTRPRILMAEEAIIDNLTELLGNLDNSDREMFVNNRFSTMRRPMRSTWTPLMMACYWCVPKVIALLEDNGAEFGSQDPLAETGKPETPLHRAVEGTAAELGQLKYTYPLAAGGQIPEDAHEYRNHILLTVKVVLDKYEDVIKFETLKSAAEHIFPHRPCRQNNQDDQDWANIEAEYRSLLTEAVAIYRILLPELSKPRHRRQFEELRERGWHVSNWYYNFIK